MGEIAEMMLSGAMCEGCGEYLGGGDGYPRRCAGCERPKMARPVQLRKHQCPACPKRFKTMQALIDHARDKHQLEPAPPGADAATKED